MGMVQVILSEDVHALGDAGEIVSVKPGYARNYLIPKGMAMPATAERVNEVEHKKVLTDEVLHSAAGLGISLACGAPQRGRA